MAIERVAIIGAGIGGLATALALKRSEREIVIVERDPEPPDVAPGAAFDVWQRPGVPQFRHAHILLARVHTVLRDHHPELLSELREAGIEVSRLEQVLPPAHQDSYKPQPGDDDLLHLWGRRPTFEYVVRKHVGRLPRVRFVHSAKVTGFLADSSAQKLHVRGLELTRAGRPETLEADLVVDASGKATKSPEWLAALGVKTEIVNKPSRFVYACRHYRLKDPNTRLSRLNGGGNLDYLGYATFYAEHGNYALTFGCPVDEKELAETIRRTEGFEALCARFPALEQWTRQSEARTKVLGAGRFENRWIRYGARGGRELVGFFPVGDSQLETNPMYGRGCAAAFVQGQLLAEVLDQESDPLQRASRYHERSRELLNHFFELSVDTDRLYHMRARRSRGQPLSVPERILNWAYESAWLPALNASPLVAREFVRAMQMREVSGLAVRLAVGFELMRALVRGWFKKDVPPQLLGAPPRSEFLRSLPPHTPSAALE